MGILCAILLQITADENAVSTYRHVVDGTADDAQMLVLELDRAI